MRSARTKRWWCDRPRLQLGGCTVESISRFGRKDDPVKMTVGELMMRLEDYPEDAEVMIMHQPDWPLREVIRGLVSAGEIARERRSDEDAEFDAMLDDLDPDERGEAW